MKLCTAVNEASVWHHFSLSVSAQSGSAIKMIITHTLTDNWIEDKAMKKWSCDVIYEMYY